MNMIRSMEELTQAAAAKGPRMMAVACAQDAPVLEAVKLACDRNIVIPFLVGDKQKILEEAEKAGRTAAGDGQDGTDDESLHYRHEKVAYERFRTSQGRC